MRYARTQQCAMVAMEATTYQVKLVRVAMLLRDVQHATHLQIALLVFKASM